MPATPALLEDMTGTVTRDASYANSEVWLSTHSANPGSTGAHELTTGSGDEGRQQVTYNSGGSGSDPSNAEVSIVIPGSQSIPWVGMWTAETGGTFLGGFPLVGTYLMATGLNTSSTIDCPAHGLTNGNVVRLFQAPNAQSVIPAGLSGDPTTFFVVDATTDTLSLSSSLGGSAIEMTSSGGFFIALDATQVFTSEGGLLVFNAGNIIFATVSD